MMRIKWLIILLLLTVLLMDAVPVAASRPASSGTWHTVARGETLSAIGRRYNVDPWAIARANNLTNLNRIHVGQRLLIPTVSASGSVHVVARGDTLLAIAARYRLDAWAIARANGLTNLNRIYVGQRLVIPGVTPPAPRPQPSAPSPAAYPGPWSAEYFDNIALTGPAYLKRQDAAVNFDWASGPPAGGMPVNAFSVRWSGSFDLAAGTYRFFARVDDGVRVYVDGQRIIDGWRDGAWRLYTADRALATGLHTIQVEYYDRMQLARIQFWWQGITGTAPTIAPPTPAPGAGWYAQYYNNSQLQEPAFATRHEPAIGFEWGTGGPLQGMRSDFFSARWTQTVYLNSGTYRFCAMSDDGVRIWVDGTRVLDEWHPSNGLSYCASHPVVAGNHEIRVEYYEEGGKALIYVWWER